MGVMALIGKDKKGIIGRERMAEKGGRGGKWGTETRRGKIVLAVG